MIRLSAVAPGLQIPATWVKWWAELARQMIAFTFLPVVLDIVLATVISGHPRYGYAASLRLRDIAPALVAQPAIPPYDAISQEVSDSEDTEVSPGDIEKYVAVYKAMQRDHTLTVDQAATQQGLTLQSFRDLESRIQRDDAAVQRARDELQAASVRMTPAGPQPSTASSP